MNMRDLIPWSRGASSPAQYREPVSPFLTLHREMNRLFDEAFRSFDAPALFGGMPSWPNIEVADTDKELRVSAELPGLDQGDVEVLLDDGALTIRGEKKSEFNDEERRFSERYYGTFERRIPLDWDVDADKVQANFKNGVLTVNVPKSENAQQRTKRIPIGGAH
jgi:HSP20 family protein